MATILPTGLFLSLAAMVGPAVSTVPDQFGLSCSGSETVTIGQQAARQSPYAITLSIDLPDRTYCYGACGRDQTYPIANAASAPIRLADLDSPAQARHILFDPVTLRLSDDQRISTAPLITIVRHAAATCAPAAYRQPWRKGAVQPR